MKRFLSLILTLSLALCLFPVHVKAAGGEAQAAAERLYVLGLFNGTGTDANGLPVFDLDLVPTRHQAITMLVRMLGKESEAVSGTWTTPFTDLADWAKPYVGYAYANKLASGTGDTTYSGEDPVSAPQYITFLLRALGYSSDSDFRWEKSWELSDRLGFTDGRYRSDSAFTRGDMAIISAAALEAKLKGSGDTLLETLQKAAAADDPSGAETPGIRPLTVVRQAASLPAAGGVEPFSNHWFRDSATITADLSGKPGLAYSLTFSDKTSFTNKLPAGYDPQELLEWGKDPGLNVDILHKHGFTGKGAVIAYVDQPIAPHEQYSGGTLHYTNNTDSADSMHGPAVLSLLTGKDTGTAPEAEVYFYGHAAWKADQLTHSECLYQIIEQNKTLPDGKKIRMVGFSDNIDEREANADAFRAAVKACEDAGIMVWFCEEYRLVSFLPLSDKNNPDNLMPQKGFENATPPLVFVPSAGRTTAATMDGANYIYWSEGGTSWTMPYVLGLYSIAIVIDPSLTQDDLREMIVDTAYTDGAGRRIVNPVGFVAAALRGVGRNLEARALQSEVRARTRYLYAVMDTAAMTEKDLAAVGSYLASITDAAVLIADAAQFADAQSLYAAMRQDAKQRGGSVAGVQIFGTPSMVPAFQIQYKVQMPSDVDDGGTLLTDLFYGNFNNDANELGAGYNVMDHMANNQGVDLIPQWPVARLPLGKGEFEAFFRKYDAFALDTALERLDIVNFSNPIFAQKEHIDDMGLFLRQRMDQEFHMMDVSYRLYGNQKGQYPVTSPVLGGFEAANMTAENQKGTLEFIINTHGQWDNIDNAIFVGGEEQRVSLVNMDNINTVLGANPYYLDAWTCSNGYGMANNLTTTALRGKCVGMFSATAVISNNGVDWKAPLSEMARSNFYYFYYHYLKALHDGQSRSRAFFTAQREYGRALIADSKLPLRGNSNYQFNLYNLLAYHNFGVIEPNAAGMSLCSAKGYINQAPESVQKEEQAAQVNRDTISLTDGTPTGTQKKITFTTRSELAGGKTGAVSGYTAQALDNGYTRFTVEYTLPQAMDVSVFDPPNGSRFMLHGRSVDTAGTLIFDLKDEDLKAIPEVTLSFYQGSSDRYWVFFYTAQLWK